LIGRGILLVFWLVALIPTLEWSEVRRELMKPGGGLPVPLFFCLAWSAWRGPTSACSSDGTGSNRFSSYWLISLLVVHSRRSGNGERVQFLLV
jgi:hypothetical protein